MGEKDLFQKLQLRKLLWKLGYSPRVNVKLTGYIGESQEHKLTPMELTDIDVLGIRIVDDFRIEYMLVDCKSGNNISPTSRSFFLRGLMDYFGAERAYLIVRKPIPANTQIITSRFNITPLDASGLSQLEKNFDSESAPAFLGDENATKAEELLNLGSIKDKEVIDILNYRKYYYWFYEDYRNLHNLPALAGRAVGKLSLRSRFHRYLLFDSLFLYTISLLRVCDYIMRSDLSQAQELSVQYLFGGITAMREKRHISDLLKTQVYPHLPSHIRTGISNDSLTLEPAYYNNFVEVIFRLLRRPNESRQLLRYVQVLGAIQLEGTNSQDYDLLINEFSEITQKLGEDVSKLFSTAAKISPQWLNNSITARSFLSHSANDTRPVDSFSQESISLEEKREEY